MHTIEYFATQKRNEKSLHIHGKKARFRARGSYVLLRKRRHENIYLFVLLQSSEGIARNA